MTTVKRGLAVWVATLGLLAGCIGAAPVSPDEAAAGAIEELETRSGTDLCTPAGTTAMLTKLADLRTRYPRATLPDDATATANLAQVCESVGALSEINASTSFIAVIFVAAHIDGGIGYAVYDLDAIKRRDWANTLIATDIAYREAVGSGAGGLAGVAALVHVVGKYDGVGAGAAAYRCQAGTCVGAAGVGWVDTAGNKGSAAFSFGF